MNFLKSIIQYDKLLYNQCSLVHKIMEYSNSKTIYYYDEELPKNNIFKSQGELDRLRYNKNSFMRKDKLYIRYLSIYDLPSIINSKGDYAWLKYGLYHRDDDLPAKMYDFIVTYKSGSSEKKVAYEWHDYGHLRRHNYLPAVVVVHSNYVIFSKSNGQPLVTAPNKKYFIQNDYIFPNGHCMFNKRLPTFTGNHDIYYKHQEYLVNFWIGKRKKVIH